MAAVHCPVCSHVQLPLPPAPGLVLGLVRFNFCFGSGRLLVPLKHREYWRGMCPVSHREAETDPGMLLQSGLFLAVLPAPCRISPAVPFVLT